MYSGRDRMSEVIEAVLTYAKEAYDKTALEYVQGVDESTRTQACEFNWYCRESYALIKQKGYSLGDVLKKAIGEEEEGVEEEVDAEGQGIELKVIQECVDYGVPQGLNDHIELEDPVLMLKVPEAIKVSTIQVYCLKERGLSVNSLGIILTKIGEISYYRDREIRVVIQISSSVYQPLSANWYKELKKQYTELEIQDDTTSSTIRGKTLGRAEQSKEVHFWRKVGKGKVNLDKPIQDYTQMQKMETGKDYLPILGEWEGIPVTSLNILHVLISARLKKMKGYSLYNYAPCKELTAWLVRAYKGLPIKEVGIQGEEVAKWLEIYCKANPVKKTDLTVYKEAQLLGILR